MKSAQNIMLGISLLIVGRIYTVDADVYTYRYTNASSQTSKMSIKRQAEQAGLVFDSKADKFISKDSIGLTTSSAAPAAAPQSAPAPVESELKRFMQNLSQDIINYLDDIALRQVEDIVTEDVQYYMDLLELLNPMDLATDFSTLSEDEKVSYEKYFGQEMQDKIATAKNLLERVSE